MPKGKVDIQLTEAEVDRCWKFCCDSAKSQQDIEFGQKDTAPRSCDEIARDNMIGKLAEIAVQKFLREEYGIDTEPDFDIYPRGMYDGNDIAVNGWEIDIKSTKLGRWLLVEWNKLMFRRKEGRLPAMFWACKTEYAGGKPTGKVTLIGAVTTGMICTKLIEKRYNMGREFGPKLWCIRKGEVLPGTKSNVHLQADNYGIMHEDLENDWDTIVQYMLNNEPANIAPVERLLCAEEETE